MKKFKLYMAKNGFTVRELSYILDVSIPSIYAWRRGRSAPNVRTAIKIERITKGYVSVYDWA